MIGSVVLSIGMDPINSLALIRQFRQPHRLDRADRVFHQSVGIQCYALSINIECLSRCTFSQIFGVACTHGRTRVGAFGHGTQNLIRKYKGGGIQTDPHEAATKAPSVEATTGDEVLSFGSGRVCSASEGVVRAAEGDI